MKYYLEGSDKYSKDLLFFVLFSVSDTVIFELKCLSFLVGVSTDFFSLILNLPFCVQL